MAVPFCRMLRMVAERLLERLAFYTIGMEGITIIGFSALEPFLEDEDELVLDVRELPYMELYPPELYSSESGS